MGEGRKGWPTNGRTGEGHSGKRGTLGLWDSGTLGLWEGEGAGMEGPVVNRKVGKAGLLIDGRVWVADGANKRPLGDS
jgi:hypothetical protein